MKKTKHILLPPPSVSDSSFKFLTLFLLFIVYCIIFFFFFADIFKMQIFKIQYYYSSLDKNHEVF